MIGGRAMLYVVERGRTPSRVLATFEESVHCFMLQSGATFGDLAASMRALEHHGVPGVIEVRVGPLRNRLRAPKSTGGRLRPLAVAGDSGLRRGEVSLAKF